MSGKRRGKKYKSSQKTASYNSAEIINLIDETSKVIAQENASRLSSLGTAAKESGVLADSVEFWKWLDRNYANCEHFASAENIKEYIDANGNQAKWAEKIIQGKGYEWDWMRKQRQSFNHLFKTYDAGDTANRPGSDVTEYDLLNGSKREYQMKAYRSKSKPHLKNTPKDMTVVTNREKVDSVIEQGYKTVESFKDTETIIDDTSKRMDQIRRGEADPTYNFRNVSSTMAKAGVLGFVIGIGYETILSYRKWKSGDLSDKEYVNEIITSGGDAGVTSSISAGIMIPITATITAAGVTSVVVMPVSFVVSASVNKIIAPLFRRGDYRKILIEAQYYDDITRFCGSLAFAVENAGRQFDNYVLGMADQQRSFAKSHDDFQSFQEANDFEYFASQTKDNTGIIVAGMIGLMEDSDLMVEKMENQNFFKRMIFTVLGKNKVTKEELKRNKEKLSIYISKAISVMYERQCLDERIINILGQQILSLCADNEELNEKINSIHDYHLLQQEVAQHVYSNRNTFVAVIQILFQIDYRIMNEPRALQLLHVTMTNENIVNGKLMPVNALMINNLQGLQKKDIGVLYAGCLMLRNNKFAQMILDIIENYYFILPGQRRKMKEVTEEVVAKQDFRVDYNASLDEIYASLLNSRMQLLEKQGTLTGSISETGLSALQVGEKLFFEGKLINAFPYFQKAANENNALANYFLGLFFYYGFGDTIVDEAMVEKYWKKGMQLGDPLSNYRYGEFHYDEEKSIEWKEKHISSIKKLADNNNPMAIYEYGMYVLIKYQEIKECISYFEKAAKLGYWPGAYLYCVLASNNIIFRKSLADYTWELEDVEWFATNFALGRYYLTLDQKEFKYYDRAVVHFKKALYFKDEIKEAAGYLAFILDTGLVNDSLQEGIFKQNAEVYFRAGLESDNPFALFEVGVLYIGGVNDDGLGSDLEKSAAYLEKSYSIFKTGLIAYFLGMIYLVSEKLRDLERAFQMFLAGAEMGIKNSANMLAECYKEGYGVKKDPMRAMEIRQKMELMDDKTPKPEEVAMIYLTWMIEELESIKI